MPINKTDISESLLPLPYNAESVIKVLEWGASPTISMYTHKQIYEWCNLFTCEYTEVTPSHEVKKLLPILNEVETKWEAYINSNYAANELKTLTHDDLALPSEWFQEWLLKAINIHKRSVFTEEIIAILFQGLPDENPEMLKTRDKNNEMPDGILISCLLGHLTHSPATNWTFVMDEIERLLVSHEDDEQIRLIMQSILENISAMIYSHTIERQKIIPHLGFLSKEYIREYEKFMENAMALNRSLPNKKN
jgi:hypothetical protein